MRSQELKKSSLDSERAGGSESFLRQCKRVQDVLYRDEQVLPAIELIRHGRRHDFSADIQMPQDRASGWIHGKQVAGIVRGEKQMAGGREDSRDILALAEFMIPCHF